MDSYTILLFFFGTQNLCSIQSCGLQKEQEMCETGGERKRMCVGLGLGVCVYLLWIRICLHIA